MVTDDIAIRVENLSKCYMIRHRRAQGEGLRHVLQQTLTAPFRALGRGKNGGENSSGSGGRGASATREEFWALRDISFEVKRGEVLGIIGRNGAGKSTLLKTLSRITEPTKGRITINGRIASLLEVGTGFHPELTGRENVFLNGAILGMTKVEILRKFDEIVAFADVQKFLDTPVKHYSSGMYVRLAFAVAAHLEPEILIVDEVLAVGDSQFQEKCLNKMNDVAKSGGRTVFFVSHSLGSINSLCTSVLYLRDGELVLQDTPENAIQRYLKDARNRMHSPAARRPTQTLQITTVRLHSGAHLDVNDLFSTDPFEIEIAIEATGPVTGVEITVRVDNCRGVPVLTTNWSDAAGQLLTFQKGSMSLSIPFSGRLLAPDTYMVSIHVHVPGAEFLCIEDQALTFSLHDSSPKLAPHIPSLHGNVFSCLPWKIKSPESVPGLPVEARS